MFGMLHGGLPRITQDGVDIDALGASVAAGDADLPILKSAIERCVAEVVAAQVEAGLDLVTDGQVRWPDMAEAVLARLGEPPRTAEPLGILVDAWRSTSALTERPVAQAVPGPYSLDRRGGGGSPRRASAASRRTRTLALADALAVEIRALADAGCPLVVVEEPAAVGIGTNAGERRLFADAQQRLLALAPDVHAMLAISGGSAADAGAETIFAAPYRSHLFDLIAGPDDWILVRAAPPQRGIVCAALRAEPGADPDQAPILVWAANYAASTGLRGLQRVGLANATPLRHLAPADAQAAVRALGRAASLAGMAPDDAIAAGLDPRTFGNRRMPRATVRRRRPPASG